MKNLKLTFLCLLGLIILAYGQENKQNPIFGPQTVEFKKAHATIVVPEGYVYFDEKDATQLLQAVGNMGIQVDGLIIYAKEDTKWYLYFRFIEIGYFKMDDIKDELEEINIVEEIKKNSEIGNKQRIEKGFPPVEIIGLYEDIKLSESEKSLEFVLETKENGNTTIENRELRFGKKGMMLIGFVCPKSDYISIENTCSELSNTFAYSAGYKYSDFNPGVDKLASIGIATFFIGREVTKGGVVSNFIKKLGIAIWAFVAAIFLAIGSFFRKIFGKPKKSNQIDSRRSSTIIGGEINNTQQLE